MIVEAEFFPDCIPNYCFVDVERKVEQFGGKAITGWMVDRNSWCEMHVHHCVWEKPNGDWRTITPQAHHYKRLNYKTIIYGDLVSGLGPIEFIPDPTALLTGQKPNRISLPSKYIPLHEDNNLKEALRLWSIADDACYSNGLSKADYWSQKAERYLKKFFKMKGMAEQNTLPVPNATLGGC